MPQRTISQFKSNFTGGGVRPNLFEVELNFPTTVNAQSVIDSKSISQFLVKSAALPASNITPIEVPFRGRVLKVAGERTFDTWTVTVLNDTDFKIRTSFEQWMNGINKLDNANGEVNPANYTQDARVYQLAKDGSTLREYKFIGVFPTNVSQIDLSMDTTDTIEEFTVELQVLYWEIVAGSNANTYPALV